MQVIKYICNTWAKDILQYVKFENEIYIWINTRKLLNIVSFLKKHTYFQFKVLIDIYCVDYPSKKNRFELTYQFLSIINNVRLNLKVVTDESIWVHSLNTLFWSSNWAEREIWDLYGVYFHNHNDLRRILTDYGFQGFPLRKDFPVTGYVELRYNDETKQVVYKSLMLAQEFRVFNFENTWKK